MIESTIDTPFAYASKTRRPAGARPEATPYYGSAIPVGLVGAATVATLVLILDALAGHPFATPNALGAMFLRGQAFSMTAPIVPGLVLGYTLLHGVAFVSVAAAAVSAEHTLSRAGVSVGVQLAAGVAGLFVALQALFLVLTLLLEISPLGDLGFQRLVVTNLVAAFAMALTTYLRGSGRHGGWSR